MRRQERHSLRTQSSRPLPVWAVADACPPHVIWVLQQQGVWQMHHPLEARWIPLDASSWAQWVTSDSLLMVSTQPVVLAAQVPDVLTTLIDLRIPYIWVPLMYNAQNQVCNTWTTADGESFRWPQSIDAWPQCGPALYLQNRDDLACYFLPVYHLSSPDWAGWQDHLNPHPQRALQAWVHPLLQVQLHNMEAPVLPPECSLKAWNQWAQQDPRPVVIVANGSIPEYDKDSGANRLREIMAGWLRLGYRVVFCFQEALVSNPYYLLLQQLGVELYAINPQQGLLTFVQSRIEPTRVKAVWYYFPKEFLRYAPQFKPLFPQAQHVYDMVDIHHLRWERALALDPQRISIRKKVKLYRQFEQQAAAQADVTIAISAEDAQYMQDFCPQGRYVTLSNIHHQQLPLSQSPGRAARAGLLFVGSTHDPNIDALHYLRSHIMPQVWASLPELRVDVVGNVVSKIRKEDFDARFVFHGFVPDIAPFYHNTAVVIAPLRYGSGVKGKVGQALEFHVPVITTPMGAEGMQLVHEHTALLAPPEQFAASIIRLMTDDLLWEQLHQQAAQGLAPFSRARLDEVLRTLGSD